MYTSLPLSLSLYIYIYIMQASQQARKTQRTGREERREARARRAQPQDCIARKGTLEQPQESRAREDLNQVITLALHRDADAKSTIAIPRDVGKVRAESRRSLGSDLPPGRGVASFSEGFRVRSFGGQLQGAGICSARDASDKFAPW